MCWMSWLHFFSHEIRLICDDAQYTEQNGTLEWSNGHLHILEARKIDLEQILQGTAAWSYGRVGVQVATQEQ